MIWGKKEADFLAKGLKELKDLDNLDLNFR
jgi:hypothetical protein